MNPSSKSGTIPAGRDNQSPDAGTVRLLIWIYFGLLLVEGALRKWLVPQFADALLLSRDPVAILMILVALKDGVLPTTGPIRTLTWLFGVFCCIGALQLTIGSTASPVVVAYGLRTYFLHLPVLFIIGRAFRWQDVRRLALLVLVLALPMALLMSMQFRSSGDAWINAGAQGVNSRQIITSLQRIRPAGTFSFISGPILYYQLVFALVLSCLVHRRYLSSWPVYGAVGGLFLAAAVSGSRAFVTGWAAVAVTFMLVSLSRRQIVSKTAQAAGIGLLAFVLLTSAETFNEGLEVLSTRFEEASQLEGVGSNQRLRSLFVEPYRLLFEAPWLGHGLGLGTNVGAALLTGQAQFLLAESEWSRILLEAGVVGGVLFICFRCWLVWKLGVFSWRAAQRGNVLPLLIFGATALSLLLGQWGQPTTLGFAVFGGGLCLASADRPAPASQPSRPAAPRFTPVRAAG